MISYSPGRVCCNHCKGIYVEAIPWAAGRRRLTTAFACYLATWARILPWLEVERLFQCAWGNVASAVDSVVKYGLENRDLPASRISASMKFPEKKVTSI